MLYRVWCGWSVWYLPLPQFSLCSLVQPKTGAPETACMRAAEWRKEYRCHVHGMAQSHLKGAQHYMGGHHAESRYQAIACLHVTRLIKVDFSTCLCGSTATCHHRSPHHTAALAADAYCRAAYPVAKEATRASQAVHSFDTRADSSAPSCCCHQMLPRIINVSTCVLRDAGACLSTTAFAAS